MNTEPTARPPYRPGHARVMWLIAGIWTIFMIWLLVVEQQSYAACQAEDTYVKACTSLAPLIFVGWAVVAVPFAIAGIVTAGRERKART